MIVMKFQKPDFLKPEEVDLNSLPASTRGKLLSKLDKSLTKFPNHRSYRRKEIEGVEFPCSLYDIVKCDQELGEARLVHLARILDHEISLFYGDGVWMLNGIGERFNSIEGGGVHHNPSETYKRFFEGRLHDAKYYSYHTHPSFAVKHLFSIRMFPRCPSEGDIEMSYVERVIAEQLDYPNVFCRVADASGVWEYSPGERGRDIQKILRLGGSLADHTPNFSNQKYDATGAIKHYIDRILRAAKKDGLHLTYTPIRIS